MERPKLTFILALLSTCIICSSPSSRADTDAQENTEVPQISTEADSRKPNLKNTGDTSKAPEAVRIFDKTFKAEVRKCELLCEVFDVAKEVDREELAAGIFYVTSAYATLSRFDSPVVNALGSVRYIGSKSDGPSPQLLIDVFSHSVAVFLYKNKFLYCENAEKLACLYAITIEARAEDIANKDCPRSKLAAIVLGLYDFLVDQYLNGAEDIHEFVDIYGKQWKGKKGTGSPSNKELVATCRCDRGFELFTKEQCTGGRTRGILQTFLSIREEFRGRHSLENVLEGQAGPCDLKENDKVCAISSDAIEAFFSSFEKSVESSKALKDLYTLDPKVTPEEFSRGINYVALCLLQRNEVPDAALLADFQSRFVQDCEVLSLDLLVAVTARFVAKYLESEGVLSCDNAAHLAKALAGVSEEIANLVVDDHCLISKVVAIRTGFRVFLKRVGALTPDKGVKRAFLYGNEWRCQSKGPKII